MEDLAVHASVLGLASRRVVAAGGSRRLDGGFCGDGVVSVQRVSLWTGTHWLEWAASALRSPFSVSACAWAIGANPAASAWKTRTSPAICRSRLRALPRFNPMYGRVSLILLVVGAPKQAAERRLGALRCRLGTRSETGSGAPGPFDSLEAGFLHILSSGFHCIPQALVLLPIPGVEPGRDPQSEDEHPGKQSPE